MFHGVFEITEDGTFEITGGIRKRVSSSVAKTLTACICSPAEKAAGCHCLGSVEKVASHDPESLHESPEEQYQAALEKYLTSGVLP